VFPDGQHRFCPGQQLAPNGQQADPQATGRAFGQLHRPPSQTCSGEHLRPQAPQSVVVFNGVHTPLQQALPAGQHRPAQHVAPGAQGIPQPPQSRVVSSAVQRPSQQTCPGAQTVPHRPQLVGVFKSLQTPLQHACPGAHVE
jgi:hypothetical protein